MHNTFYDKCPECGNYISAINVKVSDSVTCQHCTSTFDYVEKWDSVDECYNETLELIED